MDRVTIVRALLCPRPRKLSLVERPAPVAAAGAPLVRVKRAGVCGTDLHIFEGSQPYFEYPRVIGHELAGEIAAVAGAEPASSSANRSRSFPMSPAAHASPAGAASRTAAST